jgi:hypothetical protein
MQEQPTPPPARSDVRQPPPAGDVQTTSGIRAEDLGH